jgi:hypothetical protein
MQPLIQELILQESDEALTADRAEYPTDRLGLSASDGPTTQSANMYFDQLVLPLPTCKSSSMSCASTEQQRPALL